MKNFKLNSKYDTYIIAAMWYDKDYKIKKLCWYWIIKTTWVPWCIIKNINKCYNYWEKINPIPILNYDTTLYWILLNYNNIPIKWNQKHFYVLNKVWKNIIQFNVKNKYTNEQATCSATFYVNPKLYCWDWLTTAWESCDPNDPINWFYCTDNCTIKQLNNCKININNNWDYYIYNVKVWNFWKIYSITVNWQNIWNNKEWVINIKNIRWNSIKIEAVTYNIYNKKDIKKCIAKVNIEKLEWNCTIEWNNIWYKWYNYWYYVSLPDNYNFW